MTAPGGGPCAPGAHLPRASVEITATLIVGGALASRDFFAGHHDAAAARAAGQPDIFMNIMTTSGLLGAYLTDWGGPASVLRSLDLRLGVANLPGDTMTIDGQVRDATTEQGAALLTLDLRGDNSRGRHASAVAVLAIPDGTGPGSR